MIDSSTRPPVSCAPCTHSWGTPISGTPFNYSKFKTYHKTPLTDAWVRAQTSLVMAHMQPDCRACTPAANGLLVDAFQN